MNRTFGNTIFPGLLLLISIGSAVFFVHQAVTRELTEVEGIYFQALISITSFASSFIFGRMSARAAAREIIRPHARSAFRRLVSLYKSVSRVASVAAAARESSSDHDHLVALSKIEESVFAQLLTADDAIEDWRDIVPEDVDELRESIDFKDDQGVKHG